MSRSFEDTVSCDASSDFASRFFVPSKDIVTIQCGGASHPGRVRDKNEDHFAVINRFRSQHFQLTNLPRENLPAFRHEAYLLIVADGIGGRSAGDLASRLAMEEAWELSAEASSWVMRLHDMSDQQIRERIEAYTIRIHEYLLKAAQENPKLAGMGTTWTSAYLLGWDAILAHIGDSRAYLYRDAHLQQLTHDHTLAQALVDRGVGKEQAGALRHVITNSLGGSSGEPIPDVDHVVLQNGDRLLLCTDGLSDFVAAAEITEILKTVPAPQEACDALVEKALQSGGKDNVTVVLADFRQVE